MVTSWYPKVCLVKHILLYSLLIIRKQGSIGSLYSATKWYSMNHPMMSALGNFLQWLSRASHPVCVPFLANLKLLFHSSCLLKGFVKCGRAKPRLSCEIVLCMDPLFSASISSKCCWWFIIHSVRQHLHSAVEDWVTLLYGVSCWEAPIEVQGLKPTIPYWRMGIH